MTRELRNLRISILKDLVESSQLKSCNKNSNEFHQPEPIFTVAICKFCLRLPLVCIPGKQQSEVLSCLVGMDVLRIYMSRDIALYQNVPPRCNRKFSREILRYKFQLQIFYGVATVKKKQLEKLKKTLFKCQYYGKVCKIYNCTVITCAVIGPQYQESQVIQLLPNPLSPSPKK